jgi:glycosyltransferase involved in cell wall biosynthesis
MAMSAGQVSVDEGPTGADRLSGPSPAVHPASAEGRARGTSLSVIMCVYDGDRPGPLHDAVSSILAQTHQDFVLRVLVDGPVAGDLRACLDELRDTRIQLRFSRANHGLAAGLNQLIDDSLGEGARFIARMDADDRSYPERLERQLAFLKGHAEVAVLGGGCLEVDEDTGEEFVKLLPTDDSTLKRELVKRTPFVHPSVLFRSEVFAGGTRYRSSPSEDMHLWVDLARYGWGFANLPEPLVVYRVSDALFRRRSSWRKASSELSARIRGMVELCLITPSNVAWTVAYLMLRLLPLSLAKRAYRHLRPRGTAG